MESYWRPWHRLQRNLYEVKGLNPNSPRETEKVKRMAGLSSFDRYHPLDVGGDPTLVINRTVLLVQVRRSLTFRRCLLGTHRHLRNHNRQVNPPVQFASFSG